MVYSRYFRNRVFYFIGKYIYFVLGIGILFLGSFFRFFFKFLGYFWGKEKIEEYVLGGK